MSDVVVTVPKDRWDLWLSEGDLPGEEWSGWESGFNVGYNPPKIEPGERVYIVAHGRLRGYSPLVRIGSGVPFGGAPGTRALVRRGDAVAVTIEQPIKGFQGFRYRWWERKDEIEWEGETWRMP